jgi:hypothetical protein
MVVDKNSVLDFFTNYIHGYMFNDIEKSINVGANFAVAILLLTYTENIGSLISGHLGLKGHSYKDFNKMIEYFDFNGDAEYYKKFEITYKANIGSQIEILDIYTAFRCGFIHEYFPKLPCIVQNNQPVDHYLDSEAGIHWFDDNGVKTLRFHNNAYYRDLKKAVDKIFRQIFIQNDPSITSNTIKSLERITDRILIAPKKI